MTGVTASNTNTTIAIIFENRMTGHRRPRKGPSEIHTHVREYTAVKALPRVGYSFYHINVSCKYCGVVNIESRVQPTI